jgi:hypothetical protein
MSLYERALKRMEALAGAYSQGDTPWGRTEISFERRARQIY